MEQIHFSQNWNNKLDCKFFTTIRLESSKYKKGFIYQIFLKDKFLFRAKAVEVKCCQLKGLSEFSCSLDTGYSKDETIKIFKNMYKNTHTEEQLQAAIFNIILLQKIESKKTQQSILFRFH